MCKTFSIEAHILIHTHIFVLIRSFFYIKQRNETHTITILENRICRTCNTWPDLRTLFRDWSCDSRPFHFSLYVHYDPRIILKVDHYSFLPSPWFPLPHHHGWHHLLPQIGLAFLHGRHHHQRKHIHKCVCIYFYLFYLYRTDLSPSFSPSFPM